MDEVTREVGESGVKQLIYAEDLLQLGDSWEEVEKNKKDEKSYDGKKVRKYEKDKGILFGRENCNNENF